MTKARLDTKGLDSLDTCLSVSLSLKLSCVKTLLEVLESGEILATPTQRCHRLRVDNGTLMIALSRRDDRIASDRDV